MSIFMWNSTATDIYLYEYIYESRVILHFPLFRLVYYVMKTLQAIPHEHILWSEVKFYKYLLLSV